MCVEDAEIEMGVDEFKELLRLKIIEHDADGSIQIKFLDEQYEDCTDISKSRSKAAKARWSKPKAKQDNASALQSNTNAMQGNADKNRIEENREEQITLESDFDLFFKAYDKQEGRVPAQREWFKIDEREYPKILLHVGRYVAATPDKKYRKLPINYLKDRMWLDAELPKQNATTETVVKPTHSPTGEKLIAGMTEAERKKFLKVTL